MEEERANKHETIKTITVISKLLFSIENPSNIWYIVDFIIYEDSEINHENVCCWRII